MNDVTRTSKELVDRLRNVASLDHAASPELTRKAADEIERLQALLQLETAALEQACAAPVDAPLTVEQARASNEPRADGCEVCAKPLPPVGAWSMPSCPDCQEVLGFLGELQADFAERDRTQKAEMVGNAIRLICSRTAPPPEASHDELRFVPAGVEQGEQVMRGGGSFPVKGYWCYRITLTRAPEHEV